MDLQTRNGAIVSDIVEGSPASKSDLEEGDVIVSFEGKEIGNGSELKNLVSSTDPGSRVKLGIYRDNKKKNIFVTLEEREDIIAATTNVNYEFGLLLENPSEDLISKYKYNKTINEIRIIGEISKIPDKEADTYYSTRSYGSRIGAWASQQSSVLKNRDELYKSIEEFKKKYPNNYIVPRPNYWSGWNLNPYEIEFWLQGENRIHERLKYKKKENDYWERFLLNP